MSTTTISLTKHRQPSNDQLVQTSLLMDKTTKYKMQYLALSKHTSLSVLINYIVDEYLRQEKEKEKGTKIIQ